MAKTVFEVLRGNLKDEIERVVNHLAEGKAGEYATYKELCGVLRGLTYAAQVISDLEQNYLDDEND